MGSTVRNRYLNDTGFDLPLTVRNEKLSPDGEKIHDDILEALIKFFNIKDLAPRKLKLKSQDWYWFTYFDDLLKLPKNPRGSVKFTIRAVLIDPYKCSVIGNKNTAVLDQVSVVSSGIADTPLIVEVRIIKPSSYSVITKNDEDCFMVDDDEVTRGVRNYMPPVYRSESRDFKGRTRMTAEDIPSNNLGDRVGGDFMISNLGEGYKAVNFPDAKGLAGAGTKRGLPKAMADFQITYKCVVEQKGEGTGGTAQHICDSDDKLLASIDYENRYHDRKIGHIVVTLYNQKGDPKKIYDYQSKPIIYNLDRTVVYTRLRRVGNKFSIKTWKLNYTKDPDRRKPIDMDEKELVDGGKFYQRSASIIVIYSAKYKGYKWMEMSGLGSFNTEILPKPKSTRGVII